MAPKVLVVAEKLEKSFLQPGWTYLPTPDWAHYAETQGGNHSFILLLGAPAVKTVFGKDAKLKDMRGKPREKDGCIYFSMYHPSMAFFDPAAQKIIDADLLRFKAIVSTGKVLKVDALNFEIVRSIEDLNRCIQELETAKDFTYDLETTALRPWDGEIVVIGLDIGGKQWVIPMKHKESPFKTPSVRQMVIELVHEAVSKRNEQGLRRQIGAHNGKFDGLWALVRHGCLFHITFDTMMAHCLLDENNRHGLDFLAGIFFGAPDYDISLAEKTGGAPLKKIAEYLALDLLYTRLLMNRFRRELKDDDKLWRLFKKLVMPTVRTFIQVEARGVWVRLEQMEDARKFLQEKIDAMWVKLQPFDPLPGKKRKKKKDADGNVIGTSVWCGSPKDVAEVLFNRLGMKSIEKTPKGAESVSESVLKQLWGKHPIVEWILEWRGHTKNMTFITSWTEKLVDGRLHPTFKINGAVTGRMSCEEPNLQQVPRDKTIRTLIGAPPGWSLVEADLSQAELRIAAMLSGDRALKYIFQTGGDPHKETAETVSGQRLDDLEKSIAKELRKKAKAVNFGFLYGMGWKKFIVYARDNYGVHVTPAEAKALRQRYFEKYADLPAWHAKQRRVVHLNGFVRYLSGRIRHLPDVYSDEEDVVAAAERQAINSPVQGLVLDIICGSAIELDKKLRGTGAFHIVANVHDALLFEIRNDRLNDFLPLIKKAMCEPEILGVLGMSLTVPLDSEVQIGNWGDGTVWDYGDEVTFDASGAVVMRRQENA